MPRYAMAVSYLGTAYYGWQSQQNKITVQSVLEQAIATVANHKVKLICAGRTDKGVHAFSQVVHFDSDAQRSCDNWSKGVNANLPNDIVVCWVHKVSDDFHARFSALKREYVFLLDNNPLPCLFLQNRVVWIKRKLDIDAMSLAANYLLGKHDFSAFRASGCQAVTAIRTISDCRIVTNNGMVFVYITANAFLYHMVRNIVGSLLLVGDGSKSYDWLKQVLDGKNRSYAAKTIAPCGLYLYKIHYDTVYDLPEHDGLFVLGGSNV